MLIVFDSPTVLHDTLSEFWKAQIVVFVKIVMNYFFPDLIRELHAASREHARGYVPRNEVAKINEEEPQIPDPTIFYSLKLEHTDKNEVDTAIPSLAQCAVHLELLEAFKLLQETVIKSNKLDVLFDTLPKKSYTIVTRYRRGRYVRQRKLLEPIKKYDGTFQERRKAKWVGFVNYAFLRFSIWAARVDKSPNAIAKGGRQLADRFIPPLDVLMIWHSILLKPRVCLDLCFRSRILWIRRVDFPWERIHAMIDQSDRKLYLPLENVEVFKKISKLTPDLLKSLIEDPNNALTSIGGAVSLQSASTAKPQLSDTRFAAIWQGHDVWVDRMCHFLWIRSPALEFTLQNARERYRQFFNLLASDPSEKLVPPPDIELVWLAHQTTPASFEKFSKAITGRTIEHNIINKRENDLEGLRSTEEAWQARFETKLQRCFCWDCQNLQRGAEATFRSGTDGDRDPQHLMNAVVREVAGYRAVERARRQSR